MSRDAFISSQWLKSFQLKSKRGTGDISIVIEREDSWRSGFIELQGSSSGGCVGCTGEALARGEVWMMGGCWPFVSRG
jgi:hypothetical protein